MLSLCVIIVSSHVAFIISPHKLNASASCHEVNIVLLPVMGFGKLPVGLGFSTMFCWSAGFQDRLLEELFVVLTNSDSLLGTRRGLFYALLQFKQHCTIFV